MPRFNDIDIKKWKEYTDINTDSLWIIDKRDNSGVHSGEYHGNFVPQIPNQLIKRYTKKGDWVLDPFVGHGTTLIEAQRLERNSIGIDLQTECIDVTKSKVGLEKKDSVITSVVVGNSEEYNLFEIMKKNNIGKFQFIIFHPPYWDIIHFSKDKDDLSNKRDINEFLMSFGNVIDNTTQHLEKGRYCACVMGDKYCDSRVYPLGSLCMNLFLSRGFILKGIIIKNFETTKFKVGKQGIWRYRALNSDFFIFKHEYIYVFKKV